MPADAGIAPRCVPDATDPARLHDTFGDMMPALEKHGRSIVSLLWAGSSLVVWLALGLARWNARPWSLPREAQADAVSIYNALFYADLAAKGLAGLAVAFAAFALWRSRTRFAKICMVIGILVLLISFAP